VPSKEAVDDTNEVQMSETLFKKVDYTLSKLLDDIEMGTIGLPDIQRPFVWKNTKVRDLFDSIYRGYPVGYFLFWQNGLDETQKHIGTDHKQKVASLLIVDGQQRLTSLFAVVKGHPVTREDYQSEQIEISFRPTDETFEVADAAIRRNPEYIPHISVLWAKDADLFQVVGNYIENLRKHREAAGKSLEAAEVKKVQTAIQRVQQNVLGYPFTALELSSNIDEEKVAEVFVRINSKQTPLNQSDFILTLMSVFWDKGRVELEDFCRKARTPSKGKPSPFNYFIEADADQLLRVEIGYGFRRARLKYVYSLLRGKDLETEEYSEKRRVEQFGILQSAQAEVLDLQNWHDFLTTLHLAGYRGAHMISSQLTLIYAYVFYLIGKKALNVDSFTLSACVARWFFMTAVTGRYTSSPETVMERDLAFIRNLTTAEQFVGWIDKTIETEFTDDFWNIGLRNRMETSSATNPYLHAYNAAQNLLHARVLFSNKKVVDLLDPAHKRKKSAVERHHLFSKKHLKDLGITSTRDTNQIANYALVEWNDNIAISGDEPSRYWPLYAERFSDRDLAQMCHWHALPLEWHTMEYRAFLDARRNLMAKLIREAYKHISTGELSPVVGNDVPVTDILAAGETTRVEFKSTLRVNLHTNQPDKKIEHSCLKTIAAFLNARGGHLIIGVCDDGKILGIEKDGFPNEDKMNLHLVNLIKDRMGPQHMLHIEPRFESVEGKRVLVIWCKPSNIPVYVKEGNTEQFFARTGAATTELLTSQAQVYIQQRF
jgi:hypothetical protein